MDKAEIVDGAHKTTKGLRHGYGVAAVRAGVQLNLLKRWLGPREYRDYGYLCQCFGGGRTSDRFEDVG